jgi:hypothetical protein
MAPIVPFPRALYPPSHDKGPVSNGNDIVAIKRAISRAGFFPWGQFDTIYSEKFAMEGVRPFQQKNGLTASGNYGEATHEHLRNALREHHFDEWAFDETAIRMMEASDREINQAPENQALLKVRTMLAFCKRFDGPYLYGGEHDGSFADDDVHDAFDCSSSTSFLLWKFGLLGSDRSHVSGWFESWAEPGRGKYITIHAIGDHVWVEFNIEGAYYRFDTSPHGDGVAGPRLRTQRRSDWRFIHRHPKGL